MSCRYELFSSSPKFSGDPKGGAAAAAFATAAAADKAKADDDAAKADAAVVAAQAALDAANTDVEIANADANAATSKVLNPTETDRTYSSIWNNDAPGTGQHGQSMLDSPQAWSAEFRDEDDKAEWTVEWGQPNMYRVDRIEWMRIDAGNVVLVHGIRTQGHATGASDQSVTGFTVQHSVDGSKWIDVDGGATFRPSDWAGGAITHSDQMFTSPAVKARYIKITVVSFKNHPAMRAGLLIAGTARQVAAAEAKMAKESKLTAAKAEQTVKSEATTAPDKTAATADHNAAAYDKLIGEMRFIGLSIDHSPLYP